MMKRFGSNIGFKGTWRNYQQRVLDDMQSHLSDSNLNIVAAPGSGKTVLGLELVIRLNKPVLILSPTIAIRDQWEDRFVSGFCKTPGDARGLISKNIFEPSLMTLITYQALYSAMTGAKDEEEEPEEEKTGNGESEAVCNRKNKKSPLEALKKAGVSVIVADEAHHLKNEWWRCLTGLKESIEEPVFVSLTATPPYDVTQFEWDRYNAICGPVDTQISAPELVREGNLCPHQDYIYLSAPETSEQKSIQSIMEKTMLALEKTEKEGVLAQILLESPYIAEPKKNEEMILGEPAAFALAASYLKLHYKKNPGALLSVLGIGAHQLPAVNKKTMSELFTYIFYGKVFGITDSGRKLHDIKKEFERAGAVDGRSIAFEKNPVTAKLLTFSMSKMTSIMEIARAESAALGNNLRMVVLCDYIRRQDMPSGPDDLKEIKNLGVVPVFESLRRKSINGVKPGILSGTLIVIPADCKKSLDAAVKLEGLEKDSVKVRALPQDHGFLEVTFLGKAADSKVKVISDIFDKGDINLLVGTKSLLGEGWDAPSVNTLVLASFVGSYVLSNQMRGRAIRTQKGNPDKTANIWHLACVETGTMEAGVDYESLDRRFEAFAGISLNGRYITTGINRLGVDEPPFTEGYIKQINEKTIALSGDRVKIVRLWEKSLSLGTGMSRGVKAQKQSLKRKFVFGNTIAALVYNAGYYCANYYMDVSGWFKRFFNHFGQSATMMFMYYALIYSTGAYLAGALLLALYLFLRNGPVASNIKGITKSVIEAMHKCGIVKTKPGKFTLVTKSGLKGAFEIIIKGGSEYERSLITTALDEILSPIDNPRYLITRKSFFWLVSRKDFHAVPSILAVNKECAQKFRKAWSYRVGGSKLIFTRSAEGRRALLKARAVAMSNTLVKPPERIEVWR